MTSSQNLKHIHLRLCYLGISKSDASNLLLLFQQWSKDNSEEWAVSRFKSFYAHISKCLLKKSGISPLQYYKYDKRKSRFHGILGRIVSHYTPEVYLQALRFYTFFSSDTATAAQLKKFYTSMEKQPPGWAPLLIENVQRNLDILTREIDYAAYSNGEDRAILKGRYVSSTLSQFRVSEHGRVRDVFNDTVKRTPFLKDWMSSSTRRSPYLSRKGGVWKIVSAVENQTTLDDQLNTFVFNPSWLDFQQMGPNDAEVVPFLPCYEDFNKIRVRLYENRFRPTVNVDGNIPTDVVGRISFIQEPGYKLRAVANPFRALQALSFPTSEKLWSLVKAGDVAGVSYVFNQDKGLEKVKQWVSEGHVLHSIDLSDATNHFPVDFQIEVLRPVLTDLEVDFLKRFSSGSWLCPDGKYRKFSCGQPLGAYFSFAMFTVVHTLLAIESIPYGEIPSEYIAIVGDDIVLKGSASASRYREMLRKLDVPVSDSKSVTSRYGAEFLGKLITSKKIIVTPKWREITENNIFSLMPSHPYLVNLLPKAAQKVLRWWASIPQPIGCGFNPAGKPFLERLPGELLDKWLKGVVSESFSTSSSAPIPFPYEMFQTMASVIDKELLAEGKNWLQALNIFSDRSLCRLRDGLPTQSYALLVEGMLTSKDLIALRESYPDLERELSKVLLNGYTSYSSLPSRFRKLNQWKKWYKKYA